MHHAREAKAYRLHEAEAERRGAAFHNLGWGVDVSRMQISISSKTSLGILKTFVDYDADPIYIQHDWEE